MKNFILLASILFLTSCESSKYQSGDLKGYYKKNLKGERVSWSSSILLTYYETRDLDLACKLWREDTDRISDLEFRKRFDADCGKDHKGEPSMSFTSVFTKYFQHQIDPDFCFECAKRGKQFMFKKSQYLEQNKIYKKQTIFTREEDGFDHSCPTKGHGACFLCTKPNKLPDITSSSVKKSTSAKVSE